MFRRDPMWTFRAIENGEQKGAHSSTTPSTQTRQNCYGLKARYADSCLFVLKITIQK